MHIEKHKLYGKLRPILYRLGILALVRRLLSSPTRAKIAAFLGLGGFDILEHRAYYIPERVPRNGFDFDGINFVGNTQIPLGTGEAARQLTRAIQEADVPMSVLEVPHSLESNFDDIIDFSLKDASYNVNLVHVNPTEMIPLLDRNFGEILRHNYSIAYWHWELESFPKKWCGLIGYFDEIWVASNFIKEGIQRASNVPVYQMPIPVDAKPSARTRYDLNLPEDAFIFLCIFSPTSNVARKNPFGVIEAFQKAFPHGNPDVKLVVKTHHLDTVYGKDLRQPLEEAVAQVGGHLIDSSLDRVAMIDLINNCDCFVSLHRAEGFGLPIAEAMALAKPVIVTDYSGNMDFTNQDNSYLVRSSQRQITMNDHSFFPPMSQIYQVGEWWAEPDTNHAAQLMCEVFENRAEAMQKGRQAQKLIHSHYSHRRVGDLIREHIATHSALPKSESVPLLQRDQVTQT